MVDSVKPTGGKEVQCFYCKFLSTSSALDILDRIFFGNFINYFLNEQMNRNSPAIRKLREVKKGS
jgi:hypothetical protein